MAISQEIVREVIAWKKYQSSRLDKRGNLILKLKLLKLLKYFSRIKWELKIRDITILGTQRSIPTLENFKFVAYMMLESENVK